jgi:hypothetical protein
MDISGASGAIPRDDYSRMDEHAALYYDEVRSRKSDVASIAKNTGFSIEDICKIKRHIFMDTHNLGAEVPLRFTPDYDIAVSWQRLIDGKSIQEMDIVLLNHELHELNLMAQGYSYEKAHDLTDLIYNYTRFTKELDAREGVL